MTFSYDLMDRTTQITFPDGTNEQVIYDRLDAVQFKDRIGRWSTRSFDSLDRLVAETNPLGRTTTYCWCSCGSLASITDAAGNTTKWGHDLEGRIVETFPDGNSLSYSYDNEGRLYTREDAQGRVTSYSYAYDDALGVVSYSDSTPELTYSYDLVFPRMTSATNSWGTYTYGYSSYGNQVVLSMTPASGDYVNLVVNNAALSGGSAAFQYQVGSEANAAALAASVTSQFNLPTSVFYLAGITATNISGSPFVTISGGTGTTTVIPATNGMVKR